MGNLPSGFDANDYQDTQFDLLPPGEYLVAIVDSERRSTSKGGEMIVLELEVLRGQHEGRKVWDRLNIVNANTQAQEIALGTLSSICRAVGVMNPVDTSELHEKSLVAVVGIRQDDRYGDSNIVKRYRAVKPQSPQQPTRPPDAKVTPPDPADKLADWRDEAARLGTDDIPF